MGVETNKLYLICYSINNKTEKPALLIGPSVADVDLTSSQEARGIRDVFVSVSL